MSLVLKEVLVLDVSMNLMFVFLKEYSLKHKLREVDDSVF